MSLRTNDNKGFTLIELMITVAIVGIIAAVAYPSYQGVMISSYRSNAQADLMGLAASMERHHSGTFSYKGAAESGDTGSPGVYADHSPASEPEADRRYSLTIEVADDLSFEIRATPVSGTPQAGDGMLVYFSDGRKGWDQDNSGTVSSAEMCWSC